MHKKKIDYSVEPDILRGHIYSDVSEIRRGDNNRVISNIIN